MPDKKTPCAGGTGLPAGGPTDQPEPVPEQPAEAGTTSASVQVRVRPEATVQTILCNQTHQRYTREWQTFPATSVLPAIRDDHRIEIKEI